MTEIATLHDPFARWLRDQAIPFIRARSDRESTIAEGCQDFTLLLSGAALCVEFKTKEGKLSPAQKAWHVALAATGSRVHVIRDLGTAIELATAWRSTLGEIRAIEAPGSKPRQLVIRQNGEHGDFVFSGTDCLRRATIDDLKTIPRA